MSQALFEAGVSVQEFTLTNPRALEAVRSVLGEIAAFSDGRAAMGVGSVRNRQQALEAMAAGAHFLVSPVFCPSVVACCVENQVPIFCGAMTPTEISAAWQAGASVVKVFPARGLGPDYIKDVLAPLPEIKLMPTGGVELKNMRQYYAAGAVAVGVGGHLLDLQAIACGDWARSRPARGVSRMQPCKGLMLTDATSRFDVVTLGETMLRFTPPAFERFGQSRMVEVHVGGSESNTAVGLSRLGHRVSWISRLTDNPLGRWIASELSAQGVDVSLVVWTAEQRVGTYYMERGRQPRPSQIYYDRAGSAMCSIQPDDLPIGLFSLATARVFHLSGITCGLSDSAAMTATFAVEQAKQAGQHVSFDLNFRGRLWDAEDAYRVCKPLMAQADTIFLAIRDAHAVCGVPADHDAEQTCRELHARWPKATIVQTLGSQGAMAIEPDGKLYSQPAFQVEQVERLGSGDAFSAGYLAAILQGQSLPTALAWACAAAALKYTIAGDLPLFDRSMLSQLLADCGPPGDALQR